MLQQLLTHKCSYIKTELGYKQLVLYETMSFVQDSLVSMLEFLDMCSLLGVLSWTQNECFSGLAYTVTETIHSHVSKSNIKIELKKTDPFLSLTTDN
jgi:hypothetical protein